MMNETVVRSLPLVAAMTGRSFGVRVVEDASVSTASVGIDRVIRVYPFRSVGTQEEADLVVAKIVHEAVHLRYTDFKLNETKRAAGAPAFTNTVRNILEDVWGERKQARIYPGAPSVIGKGLKTMVDRGLFATPTPETKPAQLLTAMLISGLRSQELGQQVLGEAYQTARGLMEGTLGIRATRILWETALQVRQCETTARGWEIAEAVEHLLKKESENSPLPPPPPPSPSQSQGSQGDSGEGDNEPLDPAAGDSAGDGQDEDPSPSNECGDGEQGASDGGSQDPAGSDDGVDEPDPNDAGNSTRKSAAAAGGHTSDGEPDPTPEQIKALKQLLAADEGEFGVVDLGTELDQEMEKAGIAAPDNASYSRGAGDVFSPEASKLAENPDMALAIRARSRSTTTMLGAQLEGALQARVDECSYTSISGRRLATSKLPGVLAGRFDVFRHREENEKLSTAVGVFLDISGSMSDTLSDGKQAIHVAEESAWAVGDVLSRFDVPFGLFAFGERVTPIKTFGESWRKASLQYWNSLEGSTVTHQAVRYGIGEMMPVEAERKLMLVITDGVPSCCTTTAADIREAQRAGIEVAILFVAKEEPTDLIEELARLGTRIRPQRVDSGENLANQIFRAVEGAF